MGYTYTHTNTRKTEILQWLQDIFTQLQIGRITASLLDGVTVDAYEKKMPITHVASVTIEGAKTLLVTPWDSTVLGALEQALRKSDLQVQISVGETSIRVNLPEITSERREEVKRIIKKKAEEAVQSLRQAREKDLKALREALSSEDEKKKAEEGLQKLVDDTKQEIKKMTEGKITEVTL